MTNERPMAVSLARQILDDRSDLQWLAPLAREYLKVLGEQDFVLGNANNAEMAKKVASP